MKKWIYIIAFIISGQKLLSQTDCDNIIEDATYLYNVGRYEECIDLLQTGLNTCSLSKSKKEKAYVLLINTNIEKDSLQAIDKNFRLLLMNNPTFKINDYDGLDDFKKYFNTYYVYPKWAIGLRTYYSTPTIIMDKAYQAMPDVKNGNVYKASDYIGANLIIDYRVKEKFALFTDIGSYTLNYQRLLNDDYWNLESSEKIKFFQMDLGCKYFFKTQKKLNYYLMTGLSNQILLSGNLNLNQTKTVVSDLYGDKNALQYKFLSDFNSEKLRNPYICSLLFGGGIMYKIGYFGIGLDLRAYYSLNTLNKKNARTFDPALISDFNYIDNDFKIFRTDESLVITYLIYKVKRKKIIL